MVFVDAIKETFLIPKELTVNSSSNNHFYLVWRTF